MYRITDTSPKKINRWQISIPIDAQYHTLTGKCKLKEQWDKTMHWLEGWKYTISNAGKDVKQQKQRC